MSKGQFECSVCKCDFHSTCVNTMCPIGYHCMLSQRQRDVEGAEDPLKQRDSENFAIGGIFENRRAEWRAKYHVTDQRLRP